MLCTLFRKIKKIVVFETTLTNEYRNDHIKEENIIEKLSLYQLSNFDIQKLNSFERVYCSPLLAVTGLNFVYFRFLM